MSPICLTSILSQDKYRQKLFMQQHGIPVAPFVDVASLEQCIEAGRTLGYPFVLKNATLAYDGRGNAMVQSEEVVQQCYERLGGSGLYAEQFVPFAKELAVMVVRTEEGGEGGEDDPAHIHMYPLVQTVQHNSICDTVVCPAQVPDSVREVALDVARRAVGCLRGRGVFGVEMFMLADGQILYNEIAPRSGYVYAAIYVYISMACLSGWCSGAYFL